MLVDLTQIEVLQDIAFAAAPADLLADSSCVCAGVKSWKA